MHTLHILNKAPSHPRFAECLGMMDPTDGLMLTENGVLALAGTQVSQAANLYALAPDVAARGLKDRATGVSVVDYDELVRLTLQAQRVISW